MRNPETSLIILREGAERAAQLSTARDEFIDRLRELGQRDQVAVSGRLLVCAADLIQVLAIGRAEATDRALEVVGEQNRLTAILDAIYHLHTESVAAPCPVCYRGAEVSDTDDGLVAWPCPTLRAMGVEPEQPAVSARG